MSSQACSRHTCAASVERRLEKSGMRPLIVVAYFFLALAAALITLAQGLDRMRRAP